MRQLLPAPADDVDLWEAYRPAAPDLVRLNMVSSADGAVVDADGRSGSIGGPGDRAVFRILRAHADVVVVGAGTARTEGYGPHRMPEALARRRAAEGRDAPAAIAVVTRSLALDLDAPLFTEAATPTIVLTVAAADPARRRAAAAVATVIEVGERDVDPAVAVRALRDLGHRSLLVEGGPALNADLLAAGVVDELCVTLSPVLLGGDGPRLSGGLGRPVDLALRGALVQDGELYLRYGAPG